MTLDREIRLTPEQITYARKALERRRRQLGQSIARADENHRAGVQIQRGTYERHVEELNALAEVIDALDVAQRQIQHRIRERLGLS